MKTRSALAATFLCFASVACSGAETSDVGPGGSPSGASGAPSTPATGSGADAAVVGDSGVMADGGVLADGGIATDGGLAFDGSNDGSSIGQDAGSIADRIKAATDTATSSSACVAIRPFYWEIGDATSKLTGGSVDPAGSGPAYTESTSMNIASASKWFYSSYWVQKTGGALSATDIKFMNFWSGYTNFSSCVGSTTVGGCLAIGQNGVFDPATENQFDYGGGHMQKHADMNGLGALTSATLADEIRSQIGTDIALTYSTPQLAGGAVTSAAEYAKLLRKIVAGSLKMKAALGTHPVCTNAATCPDAIHAPTPKGESWHYSIGHWVEDDPTVGDGAFSSPGAFGFYPWIDASKTVYGVLARVDAAGAISSVKCGRLIRKAWLTGHAQ